MCNPFGFGCACAFVLVPIEDIGSAVYMWFDLICLCKHVLIDLIWTTMRPAHTWGKYQAVIFSISYFAFVGFLQLLVQKMNISLNGRVGSALVWMLAPSNGEAITSCRLLTKSSFFIVFLFFVGFIPTSLQHTNPKHVIQPFCPLSATTGNIALRDGALSEKETCSHIEM